MKSRGSPVLWLAGAGMEMCWLYAWVTFFTNLFPLRPFSLMDAAISLTLGVFAARLTDGKGFRIVTVLFFQLVGLACVSAWVTHALWFSGNGFFGFGGTRELAQGPRGFSEWAGIILVLFWGIMFWASGIALAKRPKTYYAFCARFDIGLAAFFSLFIVKLVMYAKGGIRTTDGMVPEILVGLFLLCGLFSLGMARFQSEGLKGFLPGYKRVAIVVGYASTFILLISGSVLWSMAWLGSAAGSTHRAVKGAALSSLPVVEQLLRVVFSRGNVRPEGAASASGKHAWNMVTSARESWWMEYIEKLLGWGLWGIFWILSLVVLGFVVLLTVRWLLSRTSSDSGNPEGTDPLAAWLLRIWNFLRNVAGGVRRIARGYHRASDIYGGFLRWARRGGISPLTGETPLEFGARLGRYVPRFRVEIQTIVDSYNEEVYGEVSHGEGVPASALRAWRVLRNPFYWPLRLKSRFTVNDAGD